MGDRGWRGLPSASVLRTRPCLAVLAASESLFFVSPMRIVLVKGDPDMAVRFSRLLLAYRRVSSAYAAADLLLFVSPKRSDSAAADRAKRRRVRSTEADETVRHRATP